MLLYKDIKGTKTSTDTTIIFNKNGIKCENQL